MEGLLSTGPTPSSLTTNSKGFQPFYSYEISKSSEILYYSYNKRETTLNKHKKMKHELYSGSVCTTQCTALSDTPEWTEHTVECCSLAMRLCMWHLMTSTRRAVEKSLTTDQD